MSKEIAKTNIQRHTLGAGLAMLLLAPVANAHHMMGGRVPETFTEGLLSGLAHPVIGLDEFYPARCGAIRRTRGLRDGYPGRHGVPPGRGRYSVC